MASKSEVGELGEDLAVRYLLGCGYKIIERNCRYSWGELDIVASDRAGTLVIVEVKTIQKYNDGAALNPEDNMTRSKMEKLKRTANFYANKNSSAHDPDGGWRIDFIGIILPVGFKGSTQRDNLTELYKTCEIKHIENII